MPMVDSTSDDQPGSLTDSGRSVNSLPPLRGIKGMPRLDKEAFSRFLRSNCQRQLRLYMYRKPGQAAERGGQTPPIPDPQNPRPGLQLIRDAGDQWAEAKLADLKDTFAPDTLVGTARQNSRGRWVYDATPAADALTEAQRLVPGALEACFLIEAEFDFGPTFKSVMGLGPLEQQHGLEFARLRTDLIEVRPSEGTSVATAIAADGTPTRLDPSDGRLRLAVSEIKLQAEPSASYFAEVVLYAMVLAGWLVDHGLADRFVVVSEGSFIWKGSTAQSALRACLARHQQANTVPSYQELRRALDQEVEAVAYPVFAPRVHTFFATDLPGALAKPNWTELDWHVDNRCTGCVYAGFPWGNEHDDHCIPTAKRDGHLSQIAYVSRGASVALRAAGVADVAGLGGLAPQDAAFDGHQSLRSTRTVIAERVRALQQAQPAGLAADSGTSAVMPKWATLKFFVTVDFDPSSATTISLGLEARWVEPYGRHQEREAAAGAPQQWETERWRAEVWVVASRDHPQDEEDVVLAFLDRIREIVSEARDKDPGQNRTTIQFYLWDQLELKHFSRMMGRHLEAILANGDISHLAWLFPSEEVMPNPTAVSRRSPLTVVSDVIRAVLAAPVSHVYSLLPVAREYHPVWSGSGPQPNWWGNYKVHPLFEDPFTDQIPAERIHEIWSRSTSPSWGQRQAELVETVERRLSALRDVTQRLTDDLGSLLRADAPKSEIGALSPVPATSFDGQLWYAFAKLNTALEELEVYRTRAMPVHEREARFRSAVLERQLTASDEAAALAALGLGPRAGRRVYRLAPNSREVRLRIGDFSLALGPIDRANFLDETYGRVVESTPLAATADQSTQWLRMDDICSVKVAGLDREEGLIALDPGCFRLPTAIDDLERAGVVDFSRDLVLDPVPADFFTKRLRETLRAIGNPPLAAQNPIAPRVRQALGQTRRRGAHQTADTPVGEVLWDALNLHGLHQSRALDQYRPQLDAAGLALNDSQWGALTDSLQRQLALIWGPPGTGKSQTLRGLLTVAVLDAVAAGRSLRIMLACGTYNAVDNVLLPLVSTVQSMVAPGTDVEFHRLRSGAGDPPEDPAAAAIDRPVSAGRPSAELASLRTRLRNSEGITIVATTAQQAHNLLTARDGDEDSPQQELLDLIAIDEASQIDVAHAVLALAGRATGGRVVFAGDDLQLDPIHQAEAPHGLEEMVGSVYSFIRRHHQVQPSMLEINYRSNSTIVEFAHHAGYRQALQAHSPDLRLRLDAPAQPTGWPPGLTALTEWELLLDPDQPASAFVYPDTLWSSQWNTFEADAVAALLFTLRHRLDRALIDDLNPGAPVSPAGIWDDEGFWTKGVGVVTPHRAQQALVVRRLQQVFNTTDPVLMRSAVDTVERFQGQERQVIIASYALGDPDAIRDEEEFLMSLNRFNVMASRARAKFIVLVSQAVIDHLAGDVEILRESALLKAYVGTFCANEQPLVLGYKGPQGDISVPGTLRWA